MLENKDYHFSVSNKIKGSELKQIYSNTQNIPLDKYRLRLLYKGQEITDSHSLVFHNIDDNAKIHISIAKMI
jgi:hypothetical protein